MNLSQPNLLEQEQLVQTKKRAFRCLKCTRYANSPVVTQCGHIFCWKCLYKSTTESKKCPHCGSKVKHEDYYPVYTDHHEEQEETGPIQQHNPNQQQPHSQNQLSPDNTHQSPSPFTEDQTLPPRPVAQHKPRIVNPNMIGAGLPLAANSLPSNLNLGKMLAGHVYLSPLGVNAFSEIEEGKQEDQDYANGQKYKLRMHLAIMCVVLVVVYYLVG